MVLVTLELAADESELALDRRAHERRQEAEGGRRERAPERVRKTFAMVSSILDGQGRRVEAITLQVQRTIELVDSVTEVRRPSRTGKRRGASSIGPTA